MAKLFLIRAVPGSGKTTFAELLANSIGAVHLENDKLRDAWPGGRKAYPWTEENQQEISKKCRQLCFEALSDYCDVVVSNTFCELSSLKKYFDIARYVEQETDQVVSVTVLHVQGRHGSVYENVDHEHYENAWQEYKGEFH